jgi:hypothetical protein
LGRPESGSEVSRVAQGQGRLPPSLVDVFDLLSRFIRILRLLKLGLQRVQSRFGDEIRMGRDRAVR